MQINHYLKKIAMNIESFIKEYEPCSDAATWLLTQRDLQSAWDTCTKSDWMIWALEKVGISEQQNAKLSAAFVYQTPLSDGRVVADLLTDQRSIDFLRLKRAWGDAALGTPRPERWDATYEAAKAAAWAAWAAADAAAWAAAEAAEAAAWAAAWAAWAAVWAAGAAAWAAWAAREAREAREAAKEKQCDIIRSVFPVCPF